LSDENGRQLYDAGLFDLVQDDPREVEVELFCVSNHNVHFFRKGNRLVMDVNLIIL
jgi:hypothetical protein